MSPTRDAGWAEHWQRSWDSLEQAHVPDRDLRISALLDVAAGTTGPTPTVLDLGCGTGTVTRRLLERLPGARSIALDVDPVLLTIAAATFADDHRVQVAHADLRDPRWIDALPEPHVDAVLTATALHWLPEAAVTRLYRDLAGLVRAGGVVAHVEQMPLLNLPLLGHGLARVERERLAHDRREQWASWDRWWEEAARDPALCSASARRLELFGGSYPAEEFSPPAEWHIAELRRAGFSEAGVTWRSGTGAVVAAVR